MRNIVLRGVENDEEQRLAHDVMGQALAEDTYQALRWLASSGLAYPGFRREHTRIALLKNEVVAALRITTDTLRVGEARLKMGGLGWVSTAGAHRHKGYASLLIQDALRYLREHNYHVAMLFGIPNFYHNFGFATSLAEYTARILLIEAIETKHPEYKLRSAKPGDIRTLQRIHQANDHETACSLLRSGAHMTNRWDEWKDAMVLTNAQGKVMGYFVPRNHDDELFILEAAGATQAANTAVLHATSVYAVEKGVGRIRIAGPPSHPFLQLLLQYRSVHEMEITRARGGMMSFVSLEETLESMIPEWESQLLQSSLCNQRIEVTLVVAHAAYRIRADRGAISIAPASGPNKLSVTAAELMHLLTGYRYLDEVFNRKRRMITPDARAFLALLFPKRTPYVWNLDRF